MRRESKFCQSTIHLKWLSQVLKLPARDYLLLLMAFDLISGNFRRASSRKLKQIENRLVILVGEIQLPGISPEMLFQLASLKSIKKELLKRKLRNSS